MFIDNGVGTTLLLISFCQHLVEFGEGRHITRVRFGDSLQFESHIHGNIEDTIIILRRIGGRSLFMVTTSIHIIAREICIVRAQAQSERTVEVEIKACTGLDVSDHSVVLIMIRSNLSICVDIVSCVVTVVGRIYPNIVLCIKPFVVHVVSGTFVPSTTGTEIRQEGNDFLVCPREEEVDKIQRNISTGFVHMSIEQGIGIELISLCILLIGVTCNGVHVVNILDTDIPNRCKVVLNIQTNRRNRYTVFHLFHEITIKGTKTEVRNDRPVRDLRFNTILVLGQIIGVNALDYNGVFRLSLLIFLRHYEAGKSKECNKK